MPRFGLKLWSPNVGGYLSEARRMLNADIIQYVELYSAPGTLSFLPHWRHARFPTVIHCAHSSHGFNLSRPENRALNEELFSEAVQFLRELNAESIIVHPGILGNIDETVLQLGELMEKHSLLPTQLMVENKPFINLDNQLCVGATPESIRKVTDSLGIGMVLDVGHAIKYAIGAGRDWKTVLTQFMANNPRMLHVSDALMSHPRDEHMHIDTGEFDYAAIFSICSASSISIETVKDNPENLNDFEEDLRRLKRWIPAKEA